MIATDTTAPPCDRCGTPIRGYMLGWFNTDALCFDCYGDEQRHPDCEAARRQWQTAHDAGNLDFGGVGVPPELHAVAAFRRAVRLITTEPLIYVHNSTGYHTPLLEALAVWVSLQVDVPLPDWPITVRNIRSDARERIAGSFRPRTGTISVRVGAASAFPRRYRNHGLRVCPPFVMETWAEAMVYVLAHELTHKRQHAHGEGDRPRQVKEQQADQVGQAVLAMYRAILPYIPTEGAATPLSS